VVLNLLQALIKNYEELYNHWERTVVSYIDTMSQHQALDNLVPKRVLIRLREENEQYTKLIISQFLELQDVKCQEDCYSRICAWNDKFYIALDIRCKSCPTVALEDIDHAVYGIRVRKEKL
jgi:hypothetical protein